MVAAIAKSYFENPRCVNWSTSPVGLGFDHGLRWSGKNHAYQGITLASGKKGENYHGQTPLSKVHFVQVGGDFYPPPLVSITGAI